MRGVQKRARPTQVACQPNLAEYESFLQRFPQKILSELEKNGFAFFSKPTLGESRVNL